MTVQAFLVTALLAAVAITGFEAMASDKFSGTVDPLNVPHLVTN